MKKIFLVGIFILQIFIFSPKILAQIDDIQPDEVRLNAITDIESTAATPVSSTTGHSSGFGGGGFSGGGGGGGGGGSW